VVVHGFLPFCFAEDTFFCQQNLIANFVIIINLLAILALRVKTTSVLPIISYFILVGYEQYVKEHFPSKYCRTWRGFKDCVIGRTNVPCHVVKKDIGIIGGYCLGLYQVQLCITSVLRLNVSIPKSHLLVDSSLWLA
jgi:hypothetical protein